MNASLKVNKRRGKRMNIINRIVKKLFCKDSGEKISTFFKRKEIKEVELKPLIKRGPQSGEYNIYSMVKFLVGGREFGEAIICSSRILELLEKTPLLEDAFLRYLKIEIEWSKILAVEAAIRIAQELEGNGIKVKIDGLSLKQAKQGLEEQCRQFCLRTDIKGSGKVLNNISGEGDFIIFNFNVRPNFIFNTINT